MSGKSGTEQEIWKMLCVGIDKMTSWCRRLGTRNILIFGKYSLSAPLHPPTNTHAKFQLLAFSSFGCELSVSHSVTKEFYIIKKYCLMIDWFVQFLGKKQANCFCPTRFCQWRFVRVGISWKFILQERTMLW